MYDEMIADSKFKFHTHLLSPGEVCDLSQNDNYCTDNNIMGPIYANPQ